MAKKPEPDSLNGFLEAVEKEPSSRCICCKNPEVVKDLKAFAEGKADGTIAITVHKLWSDYILPKYGVKAVNSVYRHLRVCEGADL
tara:strand:+ start:2655 stop:2912 length:258 start_codon:yes stop_codon:yes gene_type:complete